MLSKKMVIILGLIALVTVNFIILSVASRNTAPVYGFEKWALPVVGPFQKAITYSVSFFGEIWRHYFFLVSTSGENERLQSELRQVKAKNRQFQEIVRSNARLRELLNFQNKIEYSCVSVEVIGRDPSPWFKTIVVDKGRIYGVAKGLPVLNSDGIVGQVMTVVDHYAKVLLISDPNSAVDALVQRSRARGIIQGGTTDRYILKYVLRKDDVRIGDAVVSSGLDGVFPKGITIGHVDRVKQQMPGIFQEITVVPSVDFEKLEELLVVLNHNRLKIVTQK